ncbi:MAG: hypothetical protein PVH88_27430, partial [Ignavibacteria bacterium]
MKKFFLIVSLLLLLSNKRFTQHTIYRSTNLSAAGDQIEKIDDNNYGYGVYAIGKGTDTTHQVNVYRTYYELDLSSIPTNATIDTVVVNYFNGGSGYTLKLTQVGSISQGDLAANWAAVGNGSSLHTGLAYSGENFMSSPIKTAIQNSLSNGKIIIGVLSESESTRGSQSSMSLVLDVYYKYTASELTIIVRNDLYGADGGDIGVGIYPAAATSYPSPYTVPDLYESNRLNLEAYDNQTINGKVWFFNDTEYADAKSDWKKDLFGDLYDLGESSSFTTDPLTTDDDGASIKAYLKTTNYTTSGTLSSSETWFSNATLTGNVTVPSGVTLTITEDATINLNSYSILSSDGTLTLSSGATINGLKAKTLYGGVLKGICGKLQDAIDIAGAYYDIIVSDITINEDISIVGKTNLNIHDVDLNGDISMTGSDYMVLQDNTCNNIYISNCDYPWIWSVVVEGSGSGNGVSMYNVAHLSQYGNSSITVDNFENGLYAISVTFGMENLIKSAFTRVDNGVVGYANANITLNSVEL